MALKKIKTAIFISGTGSNLKNLFKFSLTKKSPIIISFVVTNNKDAKGINFSKKNNIESKIYNYFNKSNAENKILKDLKKKKINLICLAGFMKILSKNFIKKFNGKIINIHPSLLPKYKNMMDLDIHQKVIENNDLYTGCTLHVVEENNAKSNDLVIFSTCLFLKA